MRKLLILSGAVLFALAFQFCSGGNTAQKTARSKVTYDGSIKPLMQSNCTPCHFPPDGNKKAYNNYTAVKSDIEEILSRIQKNPGEKGFMPSRHVKLSDSTITVFKQWKTNGLTEN
jgi:hypothetical protein